MCPFTGAGSIEASRNVTVGPSRFAVSPDCSAETAASASSSAVNRSPIDPNGNPNASNSSSSHPAPSPRSRRPPESRSIVSAIFARSAGWRNGAQSTSVPRRTREVMAASAASDVRGSTAGIGVGSPP